MSNDNLPTVLQMVAWGTRLSFGLYDFSTNVSEAAGDFTRLAKEVNLLSLVIRQIGSTLKENDNLPSKEAFNTVGQVLSQCRAVFAEIEQLVPVRQLQDAQAGSNGVDVQLVASMRDGLNWTALSKAKTQYLLAHLESLKLTLSVMLQTIHTAKISAWGRYQRTQLAEDTVVTERVQMESLIIEQQLSLLRTHRLYEQFQKKVADSPPLLEQSPHSKAVVRRDDNALDSQSLVPYQEPTLARTLPSTSEADNLFKIRLISSSFVDVLLSRWTKLSDFEVRWSPVDLSHPRLESRPLEIRERRSSNWQRPYAESDHDSDAEEASHRRRPKLHASNPGPLLEPANGDPRRELPSPIGIPASNLGPTVGPYSPPAGPSSWTPSSTTTTFFPAGLSPHASTHRQNSSPAPSPMSSPRASFSADAPARQGGRLKTPPHQGQDQGQQRAGIPWRLRLNNTYWDMMDNIIIGSNTHLPPSSALNDRNTQTEIMAEFVSRHALDERYHSYTRVKKDQGNRHRTKLENCYCIKGALTFNEIVHLVNRTIQIRHPRPRSPPRSPHSSSRTIMPPLGRSDTAPGAPRHRSSSYRTRSRSNGSDEEATTRKSGESRRRKDSEGDRKKKFATLTKMAMGGAGVLTLLDGLPDVLEHL